MSKSNTKRKSKQLSYIDKYKALKENKMVLWNVGGKKVDKSLSRWTKYKINRAYKEYQALGNKTQVYYPPRKKSESTIGYIRRVNRIKRNSGIADTDINGIPFQSQLAGDLYVKGDKLQLRKDIKSASIEGIFIDIDRIEFNKNPRKYLNYLFRKEIKTRKFSNLDTVSPIHSHWVGAGTYPSEWENAEMLIDTITKWAYQYGNNKMTVINNPESTASEIKQAVSKYDNFITGLLIEKIKPKTKKRLKRRKNNG